MKVKRLTMDLFPYAKPETLWGFAILNYWCSELGGSQYEYYRELFFNEDMAKLLGLSHPNWYSNAQLNDLPTSLVIEKVNRTLEQLGFLDEG